MILPDRHFRADYTAREFELLDCEKFAAVLPVGAIEQHGPHLPPLVDSDILEAIMNAAILLIPNHCHQLFLPTYAKSKSNQHARITGKMILLNSHGGPMATLDIVARGLRIRHNMIAVAASWFAMGQPDGAIDPREAKHGIHAGAAS